MVYNFGDMVREGDICRALERNEEVPEGFVRGQNGELLPEVTAHGSGVRPIVGGNRYFATDLKSERPGEGDDGRLLNLEGLFAERVERIGEESVECEGADKLAETLTDATAVCLPPEPGLLPSPDFLVDYVRYMSGLASSPMMADEVSLGGEGGLQLPTTPLLADDRCRLNLSVYQRNIDLVERNYSTFLVRWWLSDEAWVRLWGQLNCLIQIFKEASIVGDIEKVLGKVISGDGEGQAEMGGSKLADYVNVEELKALMRQKFPSEKLNAIVENSA